MAAPIQSLVSHFYQLAYVTNDLDRAMAEYKARFSVPEFLILEQATYPLKPAGQDVEMRMALAWVDGVQIEIIQPMGGTRAWVYGQGLPLQGYGFSFHHIAFEVIGDLDDWLRFRAAIDAEQMPILIEGDLDRAKWVYTDQRAMGAGPIHEYCWYSVEGQQLMDAIPGNRYR